MFIYLNFYATSLSSGGFSFASLMHIPSLSRSPVNLIRSNGFAQMSATFSAELTRVMAMMPSAAHLLR
ncbi:MAG: hypothetical protein BJ554DRAFT_4138 [Olpidium bornovanus]|uniref:Uncharacterized protein n=1 Tax=Olpidium bornovanus TaxID=278681 RepID=A0A8H8DFF5_9FUNG|nr:MAG: hypothetical protein BJ554DRAFT_4138 [Olpidium bornovanus]